MVKLEGLESADRERLWPQLVQGFKDLSQRLKVIIVFYSRCGVIFLHPFVSLCCLCLENIH